MFLCTANAARSQMAEALLRHKAGDRYAVYSAGVEPGEINPYAREAIEELGLDMSGQHAKGLGTYLGKLAVSHLIIVCGGAAERCPTAWPGVMERLVWPVEDPAAVEGGPEAKRAAFRAARDEIAGRIDEWLGAEQRSLWG